MRRQISQKNSQTKMPDFQKNPKDARLKKIPTKDARFAKKIPKSLSQIGTSLTKITDNLEERSVLQEVYKKCAKLYCLKTLPAM
jgi:hypothetical protein